jgi:hypothetical protein
MNGGAMPRAFIKFYHRLNRYRYRRAVDLSFLYENIRILVDLHRTLQIMLKEKLVEDECTVCDYIEKKFDTGTSFRSADPARSGPV